MNVTTARIAEARAIAAELGIPAEAVDDNSGLNDLIAAARNTNHLRTLLRSEAIDSGVIADPADDDLLTAKNASPAADASYMPDEITDADDHDDDATDTDDEEDFSDPEADFADLKDALAAAYKVAGYDTTLAALKKLATPRTRTPRPARQPRGEAALRYSAGVDPALLPAGTVRARVHKDGDASAVLAVVKLAQAGADRTRFTPATADEADYGWGVMCLAHGTTSMQKTRRDARRLTMTPAKFCTGCAAAH